MNLTELQSRINRYIQLDLSPLYATYREETKSESIDGFLSFLAKARVIDATLLKELHAEGSVELPAADSAALKGTQLGAWMQATRVIPGEGRVASSRPAEPSSELRFQPLTRLGQGAMGAIDIARDVYLRRRVALKTVLPEMAVHPQLVGRFLSEMQITAQLEHPNIVPVYALEVGAEGSLGYAMKLVHGRDFGEILDEARALLEKGQPLRPEHSFEARMEVFLKVCDALEYAHAKGIVHRDLKPANIMIGRHNEVYLMDWGIARPIGAGGEAVDAGIELHQADGQATTDLGRTRIGSAIGTPAYMSPEQAAGRNSELGGRSDLYTMGLILQECVSLKQAMSGTTLEELLTKAKDARRDPIELGLTPGSVPREVEAIVRRATARRPEDRYPSVRALADDVRRFLRNEAVEAMPDDALRRVSRWISKHRMASLVIMMSLGLAGAVATIGAMWVGQARVDAMHARELLEAELETESAIAAQLVDRQLARYEASLTQFVGATQAVLAKPGGAEGTVYFVEDYATRASAPPDLAASPRYGGPVSVLSPAAVVAPGVGREATEPFARSLASVAPALRELLLDSAGAHSHGMTPAQQRAIIADTGTPALRARLVMAEGLTLVFPGSADAGGPDLRSDVVYKAAEGKSGVHWSAPTPRGAQVVLPLSAAVFVDKQFRGVAILEVSMDQLLEQPGAASLEYVQTKMLVSRAGAVVAERSTEQGRAPLATPVLDAIRQGKSGSIEFEEAGRRWMAAFYSLTALDWHFVSIADLGRMLTSKPQTAQSDPRKVIAASLPVPTGAASAVPEPAPAASAPEVDAGTELDASTPNAAAPDAASAGPVRLPGPMPTAASTAPPPVMPSTPAPPASSAPRNPFDKWDEYQKGKKVP